MAHAVLKAIKLTNCSQTVFAKKIGTNLDRVNSWVNRNIKVPLEYAFAIHAITQGQVSWQEVSPHLASFEKLWGDLQWVPESLSLQLMDVPLTDIQHEVMLSQKNHEETHTISVLADHIKQFGLQHPIGIDTEKRCIFGEKRLLAYQLLGKKTMPCWHISLSDLLAGQYSPEVICHHLRFSERMQVASALKKFIGNRQGQRTDKQLRLKYAEVKGRTDALITKLLGFRSRYTYIQAQTIYARRNQWLIDALDSKRLTQSDAFCLISLSDEKLKQILNQSDQEILEFIQQIKSSHHRQAKSVKEEINS